MSVGDDEPHLENLLASMPSKAPAGSAERMILVLLYSEEVRRRGKCDNVVPPLCGPEAEAVENSIHVCPIQTAVN